MNGAEEEPVTAPPKPTNGVASEDGPSHSSTEGQNETTAAAATTTAAVEPKTPAKRTRTTAATKATSQSLPIHEVIIFSKDIVMKQLLRTKKHLH